MKNCLLLFFILLKITIVSAQVAPNFAISSNIFFRVSTTNAEVKQGSTTYAANNSNGFEIGLKNSFGKVNNNGVYNYGGLLINTLKGSSTNDMNETTTNKDFMFGLYVGKQKLISLNDRFFYMPSFETGVSIGKSKFNFNEEPAVNRNKVFGGLELYPFSIGFAIRSRLITTLKMGKVSLNYSHITEERSVNGNKIKSIENTTQFLVNSDHLSVGLIYFIKKPSS